MLMQEKSIFSNAARWMHAHIYLETACATRPGVSVCRSGAKGAAARADNAIIYHLARGWLGR